MINIKIIMLLVFLSSIIDALPLIKNRREIFLPDQYDTWGDYCRMRDPFHPKCRGISVQRLIDLSLEQMDPERREQYREFLINYILDKNPNLIKKLLKNNDIIQRMLVMNETNIEQNKSIVSSTSTNSPDTFDLSNVYDRIRNNHNEQSIIFD
ncbi:uncharacterized protein LOC113789495 [Dermatophagoides pteronyssinus]|uniref:Uncharacterized protein n=1 Tax=Dermatophagoides pteronyssinus TaxID=6956 RepID=A0ABQ8IW20_DERPT|nr:hypothetical protein DERP_008688 [Dermatophagoides pteronyssinus]